MAAVCGRGAWGGVGLARNPEKRTRGPRCADAGASDPRPGAEIRPAGRGRGVWPGVDGGWKGLRPLSAIPWYGAGGRALGAGAATVRRTSGSEGGRLYLLYASRARAREASTRGRRPKSAHGGRGARDRVCGRGAWGGVGLARSPEKRTCGPRCADAGASDPRPGAAIQRAGRGRGGWPAADGVWKGLRPLSAIPWYGAGSRALGAGATPGSRTPGRPCAKLRKVTGGAPAGVEPKDKPSRPAGVVRGRGRHGA